MKKLSIFLLALITLLLVSSCASTPEKVDDSINYLSMFNKDDLFISYIKIENSPRQDEFMQRIDTTDIMQLSIKIFFENTDGFMQSTTNMDIDNTLQAVAIGTYSLSFFEENGFTEENGWNIKLTTVGQDTYTWVEAEESFQFFMPEENIMFISHADIEKMIHNFHALKHQTSQDLAEVERHTHIMNFFIDSDYTSLYVTDVKTFLELTSITTFPFDIEYAAIEAIPNGDKTLLRALVGAESVEKSNAIYQLALLAQIGSEIKAKRISPTVFIVNNFEIDSAALMQQNF